MVELSEGPIEHGFSNGLFVIPAVILISLSEEAIIKETMLPSLLALGLRSLLVSAASDPLEDEEDGMVEDEPRASGGIPGFPDGKMPTAKELLGMLDSLDISDEERESLRDSIIKQTRSVADVDDEGPAHIASSVFFSQFVVLVAMLSVLALIFVFFGYKLYKSLSERERKREEKKKNKQMKKKK